MFDRIDLVIFQILSAPPDLSGGERFASSALAQWAVFVGPALLVLIWVLGKRNDRRAAVQACLAALLAIGFAGVVSNLYFHPRPFMDGFARNYLHHASDSSFPSDHATFLFALGWSLMIVRPPLMRSAWTIVMSLALAVGWSRIFLGAHYPADVVGAAIIALGSALLLSSTAGRKLSEKVAALAEAIYEWPLSIVRSGSTSR